MSTISKFNRPNVRTNTFSAIQSERTPSGQTYEGAPGFARDAKSELFLLAVSNMVSEKTFYEDADNRDERYIELIRSVAHDIDWLTQFFLWLRTEANMRSASLVGALEAVKARLDAGLHGGNRQLVAATLRRADEPGEAIAYWKSQHGRVIPSCVKRGINDAVSYLYSERNLIKYDTDSHGFRFADVITLTHAKPKLPQDFFDIWDIQDLESMSENDRINFKRDWESRKSDLFKHAIDRRFGNDVEVPKSLKIIRKSMKIRSMPVEKRRSFLEKENAAQKLNDAAITWEFLAGWLQGPMDKKAWEAIIPSMGYMALIRNLRNFDEVGVSDEVAEKVKLKLADPVEVKKSRLLPMRFLSAFRNVPSLRWAWPLEQALNHSISNIPKISGKTLILVDTSSSMQSTFSEKTQLMRWDVAAMFGIALGSACEKAEVVSFSSVRRYYHDAPGAHTKVFPLGMGESILSSISRWDKNGFFLGGGTDTDPAIRQHFTNHDRVVIFTDEQANEGPVGGWIPNNIPMYTWNLAGYRYGHAPSGGKNRHVFAGLTDQAFKMIPILESGHNGKWPWEE